MTSQPDYTIIDACLAEVVRPERDGMCLWRNPDGDWEWCKDDGETPFHFLHDSDALAVVEKAVREHIERQGHEVNGCYWKGGDYLVETLRLTSDHQEGKHPDRTTALCLLALRVAGVNNEQETT